MEPDYYNTAMRIEAALMRMSTAHTREHMKLLHEKINVGIPLADLIACGHVTEISITGAKDLIRALELILMAEKAVRESPTLTPQEMWNQIINVVPGKNTSGG